MTNDQMTNGKNQFDLEERTAKLGENTIKFVKKIPNDAIIFSITSQLIRASTSIGANYCEADNAESKKDFKHKIGICKKEAKETMHWFRMVAIAKPEYKEKAKILWQEAKELNLIFNAIINSANK